MRAIASTSVGSAPRALNAKGSAREVLALAPALVVRQVVDQLDPRDHVEAERVEDLDRLRVAPRRPHEDLPGSFPPRRGDHRRRELPPDPGAPAAGAYRQRL